MGNHLSNVLQLLYLFTEYYELHVPLGGPDHIHIRERVLVGGAYLNLLILLRWGEDIWIKFKGHCRENSGRQKNLI